MSDAPTPPSAPPVPVTVVPPKGTLPPAIQNYVDLFHQVGLPWAIVIGFVLYLYPTASKSMQSLETLNQAASRALPILERSVPLLEELNRTAQYSNRQRHADFAELKEAATPQKAPND